MIRKSILFLILLFLNSYSFGQSKTVKLLLDSSKIYLRFFYKNYKSDYVLNDSVTYLCRKINQDTFYLDKLVYKKKLWTKVFRIELASDSMRVTTRATNINGKSKFIYTKEKYYKSYEIIDPNK